MSVSEEGVLFATAFQRLRDYVDDDPDYLEQNWRNEPELTSLMTSVSGAYRSIQIAEEWSSVLFAADVPATQVKLRRDYERRWKRIVDAADDWWLMELIRDLLPSGEVTEKVSAAERQLAANKEAAEHEAGQLKIAFEVLKERFSDSEDDLEWLMPAERAWDTLQIACRLDVQEALWKRRSLPFTLIPQHISRQHSTTSTALYRLIDQAARSYIFGAPLACLALQRSIIEQVLRRHFQGRGPKLADVIQSLRGKHLDDLFIKQLEKIREAGNAALHGDDHAKLYRGLDDLVFDGFLTIRTLIERSPR